MKLLTTLVICIALTGCIHKATPVTPWERVTTENAILAQLISTAEQGTMAVQTSGLITIQQAAPVLQFESQVAQIQLQINSVLAVAPTAQGLATLQPLIAQIGTASQALVSSGVVGVKNPKSQQTIGADIQAIVSSATLILSSYQAAIGGN